jgi:hypothetical protein
LAALQVALMLATLFQPIPSFAVQPASKPALL